MKNLTNKKKSMNLVRKSHLIRKKKILSKNILNIITFITIKLDEMKEKITKNLSIVKIFLSRLFNIILLRSKIICQRNTEIENDVIITS